MAGAGTGAAVAAVGSAAADDVGVLDGVVGGTLTDAQTGQPNARAVVVGRGVIDGQASVGTSAVGSVDDDEIGAVQFQHRVRAAAANVGRYSRRRADRDRVGRACAGNRVDN